MEVFTVCKRNGKLIFNDIHGYETRNASTFYCMQKADEIYNWPDFNITIQTGDKCDINAYGYAKPVPHLLVPDFNFHAWPQVGIDDYTTTVNEIMEAGSQPATCHKIGWIGNIETSSIRKKLFVYGQKYPELFDIISMKWIPTNDIKLDATQYLSMKELTKYSFLIDIEGHGYSGRLKHLLWSQRPILLVDRPDKEYFFANLKEWEHYIPVKRDLSDLHIKTKWCFTNPEKAKQIAKNALEFSKKYLTREACYERWNRVITRHVQFPK